MKLEIELPEKVQPVATEKARYKIMFGGRGSGKSWSFAMIAIIKAYQRKTRFLCVREYQNSISDSVHKLLVDTIWRLKLHNHFHITNNGIKCVKNGSEFIFKGIRKNIDEIKSTEGIDVCWASEAAAVSQYSWDVLLPTIRKPESEIWMDFNPHLESDATIQNFVYNQRPDSIVVYINYFDNPWCPQVLIDEADYCKETDLDKYEWVWLGKCRKMTKDSVFGDKVLVKEFETPPLSAVYQGRYFFGADWGFSRDPTVLIRMFIMDECLYIDQEMSGVGIEIVDLPHRFREVEESSKWKIYGDNARPETISHLRHIGGYNIHPAKKWKGSVEDGVEYLRSFKKIIIHPKCKLSVNDFSLYSYKVDKNTDEILPVLVDADNHAVDAARYGLDDYIGKRVSILDVL